jgi:hypothetical protein
MECDQLSSAFQPIHLKNRSYSALNDSIIQLIENYSMVSFTPLNGNGIRRDIRETAGN